MKKVITIVIVFLFCFCNSTCRKISKYPFNMFGAWYASESGCSEILFFQKDGSGQHGTTNMSKDCDKITEHGIVKFFVKGGFYVGHTHYRFIEKPHLHQGNDS